MSSARASSGSTNSFWALTSTPTSARYASTSISISIFPSIYLSIGLTPNPNSFFLLSTNYIYVYLQTHPGLRQAHRLQQNMRLFLYTGCMTRFTYTEFVYFYSAHYLSIFISSSSASTSTPTSTGCISTSTSISIFPICLSIYDVHVHTHI